MNYKKDYVEKNLIAYLGNKRKLLPLLEKGIQEFSLDFTHKNKFLDLFAGTGVVSRLAKSLGFEVHCNDWEYYSYVINSAFIGLDSSILQTGFLHLNGIDETLKQLNNIKEIPIEDRYISEYYCPNDDETADPDHERLFYTKANGLKIDGIRAQIARWHHDGVIDEKENNLLLALLLYEASTRSNTSGVFKGYHHGFGGTNGDALGRILKEIALTKPLLCPGNGFVYHEDSLTLSRKLSDICFDLVYLDPPYNQHQYGSNYHLLNTIAKNDKPAVNKEILVNGKKINKSAIRKDWKNTKSSFCYKNSAEKDFHELIQNLNAKNFMISYSTDGIIPFDTILDILSQKGELSIFSSEYTKYRGGKQALTSKIKNLEFVILVKNTKIASKIYGINQKKNSLHQIKQHLIQNKISLALEKVCNIELLKNVGFKEILSPNPTKIPSLTSQFKKSYKEMTFILTLSANRLINKEEILKQIRTLPLSSLERIEKDMEIATSTTKEEEIYLALKSIRLLYKRKEFQKAKEIFREIIYDLSKFNNTTAYLASLKAILAILNCLDEILDCWPGNSLLFQKSFSAFEHILLKKLENKKWEQNKEAVSYKTEIGQKYDALLNLLQNHGTSQIANSKENYSLSS